MAHLLTGNKFDPNKDIPDLSGKVRIQSRPTHGMTTSLIIRLKQHYIITGGTAGIGFGITAHLLQHNAAHITLVSQKEEHAAEAVEALKEYGDTSRVEFLQCDLKDLKKTEEVSRTLKEKGGQIDAVGREPNLNFPNVRLT